MQKINDISLTEMLEDLTDMLSAEDDYNHTMEMLQLNEEEKMIFQRAKLHLNRENPNPLIIKKAYQILMAKSFHNKSFNSHDNQNILGQAEENDSLLSLSYSFVKSNLEYIVLAFVIALILKKLFF